ncbi:MAG: lysine--tRNA ligase [Armatimonadetes bacterium]|nr:lysine--tRNA ligase [Armatimonadota bacterium]
MADQEFTQIRLDKLTRMRELGHDPFAVEKFEFKHSAQELLDNFDALVAEDQEITFAGRIVAMREMGKASFLQLSDGDGRIQVYIKKDDLGETGWEISMLLDLGDHIGVAGKLFRTRTEERSIHVSVITPMSKSLHILPLGKEKEGESWGKLSDVEQRYRHRHLDLLANPEARKMLINRAKIVSAVRHYFDQEGYLEVETPLLQLEAGGAAARPFLTHYNADVPKVYEVGRVFRNEGVSNRHNPEFTMLEFYEAYVNLEDMMTRVEECFKFVCLEVFGSTTIDLGGHSFDFEKPWHRVDLLESIEKFSGIKPEELRDFDSAKAAMARVGLPTAKENNLGGIIEKLLERFVENELQEPTFVVGYPIETSPLAKKDPNRPGFTRRFEGYIRGREVCNAFSEINDPIDQRERFEQQLGARAAGDDEAHPMDEEFLYALECGMPPAGGCGIGLDRMAMMLLGSEHLREILMFPMMKPEQD